MKLSNMEHYAERVALDPTWIRVGDVLKNTKGKRYLIAQVQPHQCCIISLDNGNRYVDPIPVKNINKITLSELASMSDEVMTGWELEIGY